MTDNFHLGLSLTKMLRRICDNEDERGVLSLSSCDLNKIKSKCQQVMPLLQPVLFFFLENLLRTQELKSYAQIYFFRRSFLGNFIIKYRGNNTN